MEWKELLDYNKCSEFKKERSQHASDLIIHNKLSQNEGGEDSECNHNQTFNQAMHEDMKVIPATLFSQGSRDNLPQLVDQGAFV